MKNVINALRLVIKYSAYILVVVDIVGYAIEKLEGLTKNVEAKKKEVSE